MINLWADFFSDLATVTASSSSAGYPASNVQNEQPSSIWISGSTLINEWVLFDIGTPATITDIVIAFHNLDSNSVQLKLQYSNTGTTGLGGLTSPAGTISLDFNSMSLTSRILQKSFTVQNPYRYWCIVNLKQFSTESIQIGRVYLGAKTTLNPPDFQSGVSCIREDLSQVNMARSGSDYGILKPSKRLYAITWTDAADDDFFKLDLIYKRGGKVLKFFMQIDQNSHDTNLSDIVYVRFYDDPSNAQIDSLDLSQLWDLAYSFLEQI